MLNNPLSYTDPSGFSFLKKFRTFAAIAVAIAAPYAAAALQGVAVASLAPGTAFAAAAAGGFASGVISGGSLRSGLFGAFSATLFFGIGETFASVEGSGSFFGTGLEAGDFGAKVLAHGIAGGVMAGLQGGNFGHGFVSAGVTQAFSGRIDRISGTGASGARVAAAAVVGGTASVLSGGKFANGALTGAFSRAFNDELHSGSGGFVTDDGFSEPNFSDAFNERAAEFFEPLATAADNAVDYWVEQGGVAGMIGGTLAGTFSSTNIGNTIGVLGTSFVGGQFIGFARQSYVSSIAALGIRGEALRAAGFSERAITRFLVRGRNVIKDSFRGGIKVKYHRPTFQQLEAAKPNIQRIQEGTLRTNPGVNRLLGAKGS